MSATSIRASQRRLPSTSFPFLIMSFETVTDVISWFSPAWNLTLSGPLRFPERRPSQPGFGSGPRRLTLGSRPTLRPQVGQRRRRNALEVGLAWKHDQTQKRVPELGDGMTSSAPVRS